MMIPKIKRIYLEITNHCNLNCSFCTNDKGNTFMSLNEIKEYISKLDNICDYLYLHVLGEPLSHPDFDKILDFFDETNYNLQIVTNGTLLNKYQDILKHKSIRKLSISIHSVNNLNIDNKYFETINKLISSNNNKCIELRFYNFPNLSNDIIKYHNCLKDNYGLSITDRNNSYKLKDNIYILYADYFKWPSTQDQINNHFTKCLGGLEQLAILSNGDVTLCCLDPKGFNSIGSLKENTLNEILNSDKYKAFIESFNKNINYFDLCKKCTYRLRFDDKCEIEQ